MEIRAIADCKTSLGEGPLWDVQEQKIYWLDSLGNKVFRANADGSHMEKWDLPQKVGSMALRKKGDGSRAADRPLQLRFQQRRSDTTF